MAITVKVDVQARSIPGNVLTWTTASSVSITGGQGEDPSRQAVATAVCASDSTMSATHAISYNGYPIPPWDFPAGHTF